LGSELCCDRSDSGILPAEVIRLRPYGGTAGLLPGTPEVAGYNGSRVGSDRDRIPPRPVPRPACRRADTRRPQGADARIPPGHARFPSKIGSLAVNGLQSSRIRSRRAIATATERSPAPVVAHEWLPRKRSQLRRRWRPPCPAIGDRTADGPANAFARRASGLTVPVARRTRSKHVVAAYDTSRPAASSARSSSCPSSGPWLPRLWRGFGVALVPSPTMPDAIVQRI
jgi:hypothetical protein